MAGNSISKIPVVYRDEYNIKFLGLEKQHPFDSSKFGKIAKELVKAGLVHDMKCYFKPKKVSESRLKAYHTKEYYEKIRTSDGLLSALEFNIRYHVDENLGDGWMKNVAKFVLNREKIFMYALDSIVGKPLRYQVGGTILAGELAMEYGWAINIGGGMHHASANDGGGWCVFADIQMSIVNLVQKFDGIEGSDDEQEGEEDEGEEEDDDGEEEKKERKKVVQNVMIIDLDVHRGNGHAIDKGANKYAGAKVFIVDIYDQGNYPGARAGLDQIDVGRGLSNVGDEEYLTSVYDALLEAFGKFKPDIVYYNAGSDILDSDPLGGFNVTPEGMARRDRTVFEFCFSRGIPIVMVTSGGYAKENAECVANSMKGLLKYIKEVTEERKGSVLNVEKTFSPMSLPSTPMDEDRKRFDDEEEEEDGEDEKKKEEEEEGKVDELLVARITIMGIPREEGIYALQQNDMDVSSAVNWYFNHESEIKEMMERDGKKSDEEEDEEEEEEIELKDD